jgi:hypothetical protein
VSARRQSFRVIEGGKREPERHTNVPLMMVGAVAFGWFAAVGVVWTAYAVCRLTGLVKP